MYFSLCYICECMCIYIDLHVCMDVMYCRYLCMCRYVYVYVNILYINIFVYFVMFIYVNVCVCIENLTRVCV